MVGACAVFVYGCDVRCGAVALVLLKVVERMLRVDAAHDAVTRHFSAYRCRGNDELAAVAFDY